MDSRSTQDDLNRSGCWGQIGRLQRIADAMAMGTGEEWAEWTVWTEARVLNTALGNQLLGEKPCCLDRGEIKPFMERLGSA